MHVMNSWLKYINCSKQICLPYLTKTVESPVLQGNGPCHFVKCTVQSLFHPVEKHFVAGIYLMLSLLSNVLFQSWTVHYRGMWLAEGSMCAPKQGIQYIFPLEIFFIFLRALFQPKWILWLYDGGRKTFVNKFLCNSPLRLLHIGILQSRLFISCLLKWIHH